MDFEGLEASSEALKIAEEYLQDKLTMNDTIKIVKLLHLENEYVYCINCANFRLCDEGLPYCIFEGKCNINGCDDSKSFKERPFYRSK